MDLCPGRPTRRPSPAADSGFRSVSVSDVMSQVFPLLTVLVTLLAVLPSGTAISCYQCSDLPDADTAVNSFAGVVGGVLSSIGNTDTDGDGSSAGVLNRHQRSISNRGDLFGGAFDRHQRPFERINMNRDGKFPWLSGGHKISFGGIDMGRGDLIDRRFGERLMNFDRGIDRLKTRFGHWDRDGDGSFANADGVADGRERPFGGVDMDRGGKFPGVFGGRQASSGAINVDRISDSLDGASSKFEKSIGSGITNMFNGLQKSMMALADTSDKLEKSLGGVANVSDGFQKSIIQEINLPPCTQFQPDEARFRRDNCPLGCMKRTMNGKTSRMCSPVPMIVDICKEDKGDEMCLCSSGFCNAAGRGAPVPPLLLLLPVAVLALLNSRL